MSSNATTLRTLLGFSSAESYGDFGLELETEYRLNSLDVVMRRIPPGWAAKGDGSLRHNGLEYTTIGACRRDTKDLSLRALVGMLKEHTTVIEDSPRASFHVHVNVLDMTPMQVVVAATSFWLLEEALLEMCGPYRRGNLHCLSLREAPTLVKDLAADANNNQMFQTFRQESHKYANLNMACVRRYGTLEVRCMDGALDVDRQILWTNLLYDIIHTAPKNFKNPKELLDYVYDTLITKGEPVKNVLAKLLSEAAHIEKVMTLHKDMKAVLFDAARRLMPYAYGVFSWDRAYNTDNSIPKAKYATGEVPRANTAQPRRTRNATADIVNARMAEMVGGLAPLNLQAIPDPEE